VFCWKVFGLIRVITLEFIFCLPIPHLDCSSAYQIIVSEIKGNFTALYQRCYSIVINYYEDMRFIMLYRYVAARF
jgi:hypothetical protein